MNNTAIKDLETRLTAITAQLAEVTKIVQAATAVAPTQGPSVEEVAAAASLVEVRMLAAHVVKTLPNGKTVLRDALASCRTPSVTELFDSPDQIPKFVKQLESASGRSLASVSSEVTN